MPSGRHNSECLSCKRSYGFDQVPGGITRLPGGWVVNHYMGEEGYLGWLALSPREHRMGFDELEPDELKTLGRNIAEVDRGLKVYWLHHFPDDPVRIIYATHFFESKFENPPAWHMHVHIVPRFKSLEALMPYDDKRIRGADAWKIPTVTRSARFPRHYRVHPQNRYERSKPRDKAFDERINALIAWLRQFLHP